MITRGGRALAVLDSRLNEAVDPKSDAWQEEEPLKKVIWLPPNVYMTETEIGNPTIQHDGMLKGLKLLDAFYDFPVIDRNMVRRLTPALDRTYSNLRV